MKDVPENELFSAYLDGELTAEEQAQFEQLLAGSESARRLLEELRIQANLLQSLPRVNAPVDFADRVSGEIARRKGEGEQIRGSSASSRSELTEAPSVGSISREERSNPTLSDAPWSPAGIFRRILQPRNLGWAMIAASLAVVIFLMDAARQFHDPRDGDVALAPQKQAGPDNPGSPGGEISPLPGEVAMESAEEARGGVAEVEAPRVDAARPETLPAARSHRSGLALDSADRTAHAEPQAATSNSAEAMGRGGFALRGPGPAAAPMEVQAADDAPIARPKSAATDSGATIVRQYEVQGPPAMPQVPQVMPVEIVCRLTPQADPQAVAARVIQRRNSVPDSAESYNGWEFAAAQTPVPNARSVKPTEPADVMAVPPARSAPLAAESAEPGVETRPESAGGSLGGPNVLIRRGSGENSGEVIVEFTGGLSQIEAVLAELEREPAQVAQITLPTTLGLVQGRIREAASEGMMGAARRASPKAVPFAAVPPAPSAPDATPEREGASADGLASPPRQIPTPPIYHVTIRLVPPGDSQSQEPSPPAAEVPKP
ncbi:MAG: hypothetical protein Kow0040_00550 [Thermogutta sp.]